MSQLSVSPRQLHTPVRRVRTSSSDSDKSSGSAVGTQQPSAGRRTRFNSRDHAVNSSQDFLFDNYEDNSGSLMPLECQRSQKLLSVSFWVFLSIYVSLIVAVQLFIGTTLFLATAQYGGGGGGDASYQQPEDGSTTTPPSTASAWLYYYASQKLTSWTLTNAVHLLVTMVYIHWLKGSFLLVDEQGELNAMTAWEQLEAVPDQGDSAAVAHVKSALLTVPTLLTYVACVGCHFDPVTCGLNVLLWSIAMLAKLPWMNGVRIFGINRTAGIDDYHRKNV